MVRKAHNQLKHKKDTFIHKTVLFLSVKMLSVAVFWSVLQHTSITSGLFLCVSWRLLDFFPLRSVGM